MICFLRLFIIFIIAGVHSLAQARTYSAMVVEIGSGRVLYSHNPDVSCYPASLTKMMTLYLAFEALHRRALSLNNKIPISQNASVQPKSSLGLTKGNQITIKQAIQASIVKSANDASYALAEALGGGKIEKFVSMMNTKAKKLGMLHTNFSNPNGLYDKLQITTARDIMKLAMALYRDYPMYYSLFSMKYFYFQGKKILSHNKMLWRGADGIKTGFINASGYNIVVSVKKNGKRLMGIIMGSDSAKNRDDDIVKLINNTSPNKLFHNQSIQNAHQLKTQKKSSKSNLLFATRKQDSIFDRIG